MSGQQPNTNGAQTRPFHIMCKPAGPQCNLRCRYCFYTEKESLFGPQDRLRMSDEVLEAYVRRYIEASQTPGINFAWQGGEPTLMGLDFFRRAVELQERYADGKPVSNSFQTNGILLDDEWCEFLAEQGFLVGLSMDGPADVHDEFRVTRGGEPTFERVKATLNRLQKHGVEYNILCSVTSHSTSQARRIYRFFKATGTQFVQFIPIVERAPDRRAEELGLALAEPRPIEGNATSEVMPWSVDPEEYGEFLCEIFDEWVQRDVGSVFVQVFDVALNAWMGNEPPLCNFATTCGDAMVIEHNGDVYSCDHFVYPDHRLGNIMETPIKEIVAHPRVRELGRYKRDGLPEKCRACEVLFACHGGCPKNRFAVTEDGQQGLNYLCPAYYRFFRHIDGPMRRMVRLLRQGRPAAEIMRPHSGWPAQARGRSVAVGAGVGRNDPCPCGSGRKFKHCCGRQGR